MSVVFFTDRDLGLQFPEILRQAGLRVERHTDHFPHDCPDDVWLSAVGSRGWVALTHDSPVLGKVYRASAMERSKNPAARGRVELWYPKR